MFMIVKFLDQKSIAHHSFVSYGNVGTKLTWFLTFCEFKVSLRNYLLTINL